MSSTIQSIKNLIGVGETVEKTEYRCTECGTEFTSAKDQDRAQCLDCLSRDVEPVE